MIARTNDKASLLEYKGPGDVKETAIADIVDNSRSASGG
jgi:hypothetical protein